MGFLCLLIIPSVSAWFPLFGPTNPARGLNWAIGSSSNSNTPDSTEPLTIHSYLPECGYGSFPCKLWKFDGLFGGGEAIGVCDWNNLDDWRCINARPDCSLGAKPCRSGPLLAEPVIQVYDRELELMLNPRVYIGNDFINLQEGINYWSENE